MESICRLLVIFSFVNVALSQSYSDENPYLEVRWLDLEIHQWKPEMLDQLEQEIDDELKYVDERKGIECESIEFEQQQGFPKEEDTRFLVTSIRGFCRDRQGVLHPIPKEIIIVAMEREIEDIQKVIGAKVYKIGHIQIYQRDRNFLNFIIIPISVGFVVFLFILTFVLRLIRDKQKRKFIVDELEKKKDSTGKKTQTVPNPDPNANENQRLLQLDPNVVGNASNTLGSPKEFTNESQINPMKTTKRLPEVTPTLVQTRDNRFPTEPKDTEMISLQEQPRVVVRTIRNDGNPTNFASQHYSEPSGTRFVPIPVQVEHSGPEQQRFVPPPYHSDPYYRHNNV